MSEARKQLAGGEKTLLALSRKNNSTRGGLKERGRDAGILPASATCIGHCHEGSLKEKEKDLLRGYTRAATFLASPAN